MARIVVQADEIRNLSMELARLGNELGNNYTQLLALLTSMSDIWGESSPARVASIMQEIKTQSEKSGMTVLDGVNQLIKILDALALNFEQVDRESARNFGL